MIVTRCLQCGIELKTEDPENTNSYQEKMTEDPCQQCMEKINSTPEGKLLYAIFRGSSQENLSQETGGYD